MEQCKENLKSMILEVLAECPSARGNDTILILQTLRKLGFKIYIDYSEISRMPSFESITRYRRFIQYPRDGSKGQFLPPEDIQDAREVIERKYRAGLGEC